MKIIGKTEGGYIIDATEAEVKAILTATGLKDTTKIVVGDKIPAFDYSGVIVSCKAFKDSYDYRALKSKMLTLSQEFNTITESIDSLSFEK